VIKRLFAVLVLALVVVISAHGIASAAVVPDELRISFWPEYEDSQVFVLEKVQYPADTPLPVEVKMAVPKGATLRWTGEIVGTDASQDITATPKVNEQADYDEVVFTLTKSRTAQLEAKWAGLKVKGKDRSLILDWTQRYDAKQTVFEFRKPSEVTDLKLSEPFGQTSPSASGREFTETAPLSLAVGQTVNLNIVYKRSTNEPTVTQDQSQQQQPATPQSSGSKSDRSGLVIIALVVGAAVFIVFMLARKKSEDDEEDVGNKKSTKQAKAGKFKAQVIVLVVFAGILVAVIANAVMNTSQVPSGSNCQQNQAYLQDGVDAYKEAFGVYPTDLKQLLESKDGKGPFVETVSLTCPTEGSPYTVIDGVVQQASK